MSEPRLRTKAGQSAADTSRAAESRTPPAADEPRAGGTAPRFPRSIHIYACLILGLLTLSIITWWHVWISGDPASTITCRCGDPSLYVWFIQLVPWSIGHLHNPLLTNEIYAGQGGANTLDTAVLLPPLVISPITVIFGPIMAFNVLVLLVPVVNGWTMFVFLRKVTGFLPGQLIAATFYGFSPYVVSNIPYGHFNVDLLFFPPLALWCLYDLLIAGRHRPLSIGLGLGALVVVQFFTGPELLATSALVGVLAGGGLVIMAPRVVLARLRPLCEALGVAAALAAVVLAYPVWFLVAGPRHTEGYPWPNTPQLASIWSDIVQPGAYSVPSLFDKIGGYFGPRGPSLSYLGFGLLAALALSIVVWRRRRLAWCLVALGSLGWLLSLGTGVKTTSIWLPWRIFDHAPVVSEILPERFAVFSDLAAAGLLALSLQLWWARRQRVLAFLVARWGVARRRMSTVYGAACCAIAIAVLLPMAATYGTPYAIHDEPPPMWFQDVAPRLAPGTVLLTVPYPSSAESQAMVWQADADFAYAMVGGYALVPGRDGRRSIYVDPPDGAQATLDALSFGATPEPIGTLAETTQLRQALKAWGVQVVVVAPQDPDDRGAVGFLTATLGREPIWQDGVWVWYGLGSDPPIGMGPLRLFICATLPATTPLETPSCVLRP